MGAILDVRTDGTAALVVRAGDGADATVYEQVDLVTGASSTVLEVGWPETAYGSYGRVGFTKPTGASRVVYASDGVTESVMRVSGTGATLATLYTQAYVEGPDHLRWLYGQEGTSVVVAYTGGMALVTNTGSVIRDLSVPPDRTCDPVRWWDADTLLATCRGGPAVAPHQGYHQLWLIETDGTAGDPLSDIDGSAIVVDFGLLDAWRWGSGVLAQWNGDCGAAEIRRLAGGASVPLGLSFPGADGVRMLGIDGDVMGVYGWKGCDASVGSLYSADLASGTVTELVGPVGDARGVVSAAGLAQLYP